MEDLEDWIDEIGETIRQAKERGKPAHFLIGAGVSKSAGIPLASALVDEILDKYRMRCERRLGKPPYSYGACMKQLTSDERRDLISPYLRDAKINWGHIALAKMIDTGMVERVLTVNFDNVLARACGLLGVYPATYDFATAPSGNLTFLVNPAIVHLHGQGHGVRLMNTDEETSAHAEAISPVVRLSLNNHPLVVIGYSGEADDLFRVLGENHGSEKLYWLGHSDTPSDKIKAFVDKHEHAHYFGGCEADLVLVALAKAANSWPPKVFTDPEGHLLEELAPVDQYPGDKDASFDILTVTREKLSVASKENETGHARLVDLILDGKYEAASSFVSRPEDNDTVAAPAEMLAMLQFALGNELINKSRRATDPGESERLLAEAEAKYTEAVRIKPDSHEAYYNWGNSLLDRAKRARDPSEAEGLFDEASAKYAEAVRIKLDKHEAYNNWGNSLLERAKRARDPSEAERLFDEASAKYAEAVRIKPDKHEAYYNWGNSLLERAKRARDPSEAEGLFDEASAKYAEAVRIKPDSHEAYYNWGNSLLERAKRARDPSEAEGLFDEASAKYAEAVRIKPDSHEAYNNWGNSLLERAKRARDPSEAEGLFDEASAKYAEAVRIKPDSHEAYNNWGNSLLERAKRARDPSEAEGLFDEASAKYAEAVRIKPDSHEAYNNWGNSLLERAKRARDPSEAERLFDEASAKYAEAVRIKPDKHEAYNNWGSSLLERAKRARDPSEAEGLFDEASAKYAEAVRIKPDSHEAYNNWGSLLSERAKRARDPSEAERLFAEAEIKLRSAQKLSQGQTYNLACLAALRGEAEQCRDWFEQAERAGTLPDRTHLETDDDLVNVRDLSWFRELLQRAK